MRPCVQRDAFAVGANVPAPHGSQARSVVAGWERDREFVEEMGAGKWGSEGGSGRGTTT